MSSKEVFRLRKAGDHVRALALGREVYEAEPRNPWNIRAYGWCLYDAVKRAERANDRETALVRLVELGKLAIPEDDDLLKFRAGYEITLLGSESSLAEELHRSKKEYRENPGSLEALKDYAWTLCKGMKQAEEKKDTALAGKLYAELERAAGHLPSTEEALLEQVRRCRLAVNPTDYDALVTRAGAAAKGKKHGEAIKLYRQALRHKGLGLAAEYTSLGWEICHALKGLAQEENVPASRIVDFFDVYVSEVLPNIEIPSLLHSTMIGRLAHFMPEHPRLFRFARPCLGGNAFRGEDFDRYRPEGSDKDFDGLVEKVIRAVSKSAINPPADAPHELKELEWTVDFVGSHFERFPGQAWFPHYYGKLLITVGRLEEAREYVLAVLKDKRNEFWAWENLAATYGADQIELRIDCLCRALQCRVQDEAYLLGVRTELARQLAATGHSDKARAQVDRVGEIREEHRWARLSAETREMADSEWYKAAVSNPGDKAFYTRRAARADRILYDSADWTDAVVTGRIPPGKGRPPLTMLGYSGGGRTQEILVSYEKYEVLDEARPGDPVRIVVEERKGRNIVALVDVREGTRWDAIPVQVGLVKHVNTEKGITAIALGKSEHCVVRHDRIPATASLRAGQAVAVRMRVDRQTDRIIPLTVEETSEAPSPVFARAFEGPLKRLPNGPGFVGDVYIPYSFLEEIPEEADVRIGGQAVLEWNARKKTHGWRAVSAHTVE